MENRNCLNSAFSQPEPEGFWNARSIASLGLTALLLTVLAAFAARGVTQPLGRLALAVEAFGRRQLVEPLPDTGPDDMRRTAQAFIRMQERLSRFVEDRTRMLAAVGHHLRTLLTSPCLRAEFVSDDELRDKRLSTIAEIESMTEMTLAFVREQGAAEPP
ncbi:HAMP domain-containing protein [Xanthobacter sp. KR7-65]|uniref:HAMP domain-containing protein n=1 Tax=Xanthobacter sp. KR7-65 TaxID=3156612 RepID=UPI0032B523CC